MKNLVRFRLWHAILPLAISVSVSSYAQDGPGGKPEIMAPMHDMAHGKAKVASTSLTVSIDGKTISLAAADLAAMLHETITVINGHTKASETYSGVAIAAILAKLGMPFEKANEHTLLRTILTAQGTDGYKVVLSTYETLAPIRGQSVLIADTLNGKPLADDGAFKLVIPGDARPQRWVQNLRALAFITVE